MANLRANPLRANPLRANQSGAELDLSGVLKRLDGFPGNVQKRLVKKSFRKVGRQVLRALKSHSPRSGTPKAGGTVPLYKDLKVSFSRRYPIAWVGLKNQYYYKTLDFHSKRGQPLAPWFESAWNRQKHHVTRTLLRQVSLDIAFEAGKNYARARTLTRS